MFAVNNEGNSLTAALDNAKAQIGAGVADLFTPLSEVSAAPERPTISIREALELEAGVDRKPVVRQSDLSNTEFTVMSFNAHMARVNAEEQSPAAESRRESREAAPMTAAA